jgi:5-hydroxyisourate hydrolase-like protein (transthyretin family)
MKLTPTRSLTGTISGRIRDSLTGRPLAGISVALLRRDYSSTGQETLQSDVTVQTNDLGEYRMYWVKPGRYYVAADGTGRPSSFNSNAVHIKYGFSFYPGGDDIERATVVDIQSAGDVTGIDFTLVRPASYRIRGRVVDSRTQQPPPRVSVGLESWNVHGTSYSSGTNYNAGTGTFEIADVIPGTYKISARLNGENAENLNASNVVVIGNSDVTGLLLSLGESARISGRIAVNGELPAGSTLSSIGVGITLIPVRSLAVRQGSINPPDARATADGTFTLKDIPEGDFRISTYWLPAGFYLKEARLDGNDVLGKAVSFSRGRDLEIVLSDDGGQLDGIVKSEALQPASSARVVLVPEARENIELYKAVYANKDGRFTLSGIAPGSYKLFAWDSLEGHDYFDPEVLKRFEEKGIPLRVTNSSKQTQDLELLLMQALP